ncbi:MAG: hypothetical protein H6713_06695 [Myxococcales bacterium]|nr:hypothetical protein [Myxococcales bacterium]
MLHARACARAACALTGCDRAGAREREPAAAPASPSAPAAAASTEIPAGTYDDLPVADDDLLRLEQLLTAKWTFFLVEMDLYNQARDSANNEAIIQKLERVFAPQFEFNAYVPGGAPFGDVQGTYSPRSWIEANDAAKIFGRARQHSGLLVPSFRHVLSVARPGERVVLRGYHEHVFIGAEVRLAVGDARHIAQEVIVFEKRDGVWRVTDYEETNWSASELGGPALPRPSPGDQAD